MYILSAVELRRAAGSDAIGPEGLNSFFFDLFIPDEVVEIVGCKICDRSTIGEFGPWT
jgi:hypothetical protein